MHSGGRMRNYCRHLRKLHQSRAVFACNQYCSPTVIYSRGVASRYRSLFPKCRFQSRESLRGCALARILVDLECQRLALLFFDEYPRKGTTAERSEEHTSELQSHFNLFCRLLLEKKKSCL